MKEFSFFLPWHSDVSEDDCHISDKLTLKFCAFCHKFIMSYNVTELWKHKDVHLMSMEWNPVNDQK